MRFKFFRNNIRNQIRQYPFSNFFWIVLSRLERKNHKYKISENLLDIACSFFFFKTDNILIETIRFGDFEKKKGICLISLKQNFFLEKIWWQFLFQEKSFSAKEKILKSFIFFFPSKSLVWQAANVIIGIEFADFSEKNLWTVFKKNIWARIGYYISKNKCIYHKLENIKKSFIKSLKTDFFSWVIGCFSFGFDFDFENCNRENFSALISKFYLCYSLKFNLDCLISFFKLYYPVDFKNDKVKEEQDIYCRFLTFKINKLTKKNFYLRLERNQELLYGEPDTWVMLLKKIEKTNGNFLNKVSFKIFFSYQPFFVFTTFFFLRILPKNQENCTKYLFAFYLFHFYFLEIEKIRLIIFFFKKKNWTMKCYRSSLEKRGMLEKNVEISSRNDFNP